MTESPELPDVPFTWPQAHSWGVRRHQLDRAVRERRVRRVLVGVYLRSDVPDTMLTRAQAAGLVVSEHAVVCDRTASWIHGVDIFDFRELDVTPPLETVVLRGHPQTRRPQCRGGVRDLRPEDICRVAGLAVTTPLRTALDLGCKLSRRKALAAIDALARAHGIEPDRLIAEAERYFRRRGVVKLRELLPLVDPRAESPGESWTRLEIIDAGLPVPEVQWWVCVDGVPVFRLDLAYPHAKVAVEYDGQEFHTEGADREHDERRRGWLRRRGWTVIVVTKDSFTGAALAAWLIELREALGL